MPWANTCFLVLVRNVLLWCFVESWVTVALSGHVKPTLQLIQGRVKQSRPNQYHFIHVGKTGGTSLRSALVQCVNQSAVLGLHKGTESHGHHEGAKYLYAKYAHMTAPEGEDLILAVRSPIHRFVSGFLSRMREGRPAYHIPWTREEKMIYQNFATPDELACALNQGGFRGDSARSAVHYMKHVFADLEYMFAGIDTVQQLVAHHNILFVARTEHLAEDYSRLIALLQKKGALTKACASELPKIHASPLEDEDIRKLGRCAVSNLQKWYAHDYMIIEYFAQHGLLDESYAKEIRDLDAAPPDGETRVY